MSKRIVVPGELVTEERKKLGSHVFVREGKIYSECIGLVNDESDFASVVPLEGRYTPQVGDIVIGIIVGEKFSMYSVDINSFYEAMIMKRDLREVLKPGTIVSAKISKVNELNEVELVQPRMFFGGEIIEISAVKIPRVIGREGSMLNALKDGTGSNLIVGKNGRIWAKGGDTMLFKKAIAKISREAHLDNLTNSVSEFLAKSNPNAQMRNTAMQEGEE
ncbi:Exosome complex component Rrp4 [uncultured archaeon]|nr:Exosome complex component Rrp4 [uncultured archaeon]